jgi:hypothetical protein
MQGCDQPDWGEPTVADAWLPTGVRIPSKMDGGPLKGGAPRAVWLTSETDPRVVSARSVAQDLGARGLEVHVVWNPWEGDLIQLLPATRAARALDQVGREGRACLQIMVVGRSREPFTASRLNGLTTIMNWLDSWGVARRWPSGPPLPVPHSYQCPGDRRLWARGGHFGHSQVPGCTVPGPGAIDVRKITGPDTPPTVPRPRVPSGRQATLQSVPRPVHSLEALPQPPEPTPVPVPERIHT